MAVVQGPALSLEASGNLGAICYTTIRGIQIARDVWTGTVPNTTKQIEIQNIVKDVAQAWGQTLDTDDRSAWEDYAKSEYHTDRFGKQYHPSGYQLYMGRNIQRKRWGLAILNKPQVKKYYLQWWSWIFEYQITYPRLRMEALGFPSGKYPDGVEFWRVDPFSSGGRKPLEGEWRFKKYKTSPPFYWNWTGAPSGFHWLRMRLTDDNGLVSPFKTAQVEVP